MMFHTQAKKQGNDIYLTVRCDVISRIMEAVVGSEFRNQGATSVLEYTAVGTLWYMQEQWCTEEEE